MFHETERPARLLKLLSSNFKESKSTQRQEILNPQKKGKRLKSFFSSFIKISIKFACKTALLKQIKYKNKTETDGV